MLLILSVCCRKDERNGLGQTVLVLQPTDYVPTGQCYARGAEYDTGVSVRNLGGDEEYSSAAVQPKSNLKSLCQHV